jgi:hypothetical protein
MEGTKMRSYRLTLALFLALPLYLAAQTNSGEDIFTIAVAPPISTKDVQVRYVLNGNPQIQQSSTFARPEDQRILIKNSADAMPAKSIRAIVFAPGCQFATIKADDLAAGSRQAEFQCQKLSTTPLHGKADTASLSGRDLQVEALYLCNWAGQFFGVQGLAISPFSVAKARVENDGSFALDLPDFSADPLWANVSHNATLMFFLVDASTGAHLARLSAPGNISRRGALKIAASYPAEIQFSVRQ